MNFEKQLKSGLRKCPLHKFGATYIFIKDQWYQCDKCKGFVNVGKYVISKEGLTNLKIKPEKWGIHYEFI